MSARQKLKRVIAVLGALLCVEIGFLAYQMNDSAGSVSRNLDLGNKYLLAEDYDSAISAFSKAIEIDSMNADAYIGRGDAYKAKEDYANAWADYEKAQELSGDTDLLRNKIGATEITVVAPNGSGVDGAAVQLIGSEHSYDFVTDSAGQISEVIFPEKYSVEINKESFETAKTELSAESGGITVGQIKLKSVYEKAIADYKSFIRSKNNSYKIYDIDKDGYPELFFSELHYQEREAFTDIYTYSDGEFTFLDRTYGFIFWQRFPIYASYPSGNGIVQYAMGRGKEIVSVEWWDEGENRFETVYSTNFLQDHIYRDQMYYRDICDDAYENETEINHQFYQSETSCPYFEGSYLLGLSAKDNFTAVYEAFGVEVEEDAVTENKNSTFGGISTLDPGVEISTTVSGETCQVRYDSAGKTDEYVEISLYVNDIAESYRLDEVYYPSIEYVYVTDIDANDSYCNIAVVIGGEDDDSSTYFFAFSDREISMIQEFQGRLISESVSGNGIVLLEYGIGMGIRDYGSFRVRPEISVHDLSAELVNLHSVRRVNSDNGNTYEDEFRALLSSDLTVYAEPECTSVAGVIPAGTSVLCEYVMHAGAHFYVTGESVSGYVTSSMLRASCKDMFFVG